MSAERYSVSEVADLVNKWCSHHHIAPLHNGAGTQVTVRNIRYYQTLGLVDRPVSADGMGFTDKHRLQLIGIRVLQAKGQPLSKIQSLLYGRTEEELREVERRGLDELTLTPTIPRTAMTNWKVIPITADI